MCTHSNDLVALQIERLRTRSLAQIQSETIAKRRRWFADRYGGRGAQPFGDRPCPRAAFEALFFDYMGLAPADLPIVAESDDEIVWLSRNACPTLEACGRLGLDTRIVCRGAYEKSTQAFISLIDPQLRFMRDYCEIRPYAEQCRERLVRVDFTAMMRLAVVQARQSKANGNKGYGAIVAIGNRVVASAYDTAASERDPSAHAEMNAIRAATKLLGDANLSGAVLFSSCEPCPMCAAAAVWANVSTIVFGASIARTAAQGRSRILLGVDELIARSPIFVEVVPGVLEEECLALY